MFHRRILALGIVTVALAGCGGAPSTTYTPPASDRPIVPNSAATYSGTLTETFANNQINSSPVVTTMTANVSTVISTSGTVTAPTYTAVETDAGQLKNSSSQTTTTETVSAASPQVIRATSVAYADTSAGAVGTGETSTTTYGANNGEIDILPEINSSFTNDASETYVEYDPGQVGVTGTAGCAATIPWTIDRTVNADGTYTQCTAGMNDDFSLTNDVAVENADFTGTYSLAAVADGGRAYEFGAPNGTNIAITYLNPNASGPAVTEAPDWITANGITAPSTETDTIAANVTPDTRCNTEYQEANSITQTITTADSVIGTLERRKTTTFDVAGTGTICVLVSDSISEYYDYTETTTNPSSPEAFPTRLTPSATATTPVQLLTMTEALTLGGAAPASAKRATASVGAGLSVPPSLVSEPVMHFLHSEARRRLAQLKRGSIAK